MIFLRELVVVVHLVFQQHDPAAGLDGADFSVFVHGDHQQAVHHPLLRLAGVHQQVGSAGTNRTENIRTGDVCPVTGSRQSPAEEDGLILYVISDCITDTGGVSFLLTS